MALARNPWLHDVGADTCLALPCLLELFCDCDIVYPLWQLQLCTAQLLSGAATPQPMPSWCPPTTNHQLCIPRAICRLQDIVGYTQLCAKENMCASDVVQLLNEIFSEFDKLSRQHGVYKIDVIGGCGLSRAGARVQSISMQPCMGRTAPTMSWSCCASSLMQVVDVSAP
jgi:hypothetical protein